MSHGKESICIQYLKYVNVYGDAAGLILCIYDVYILSVNVNAMYMYISYCTVSVNAGTPR